MMEVDRIDGRSPNQMRPLACSRNLLHRAHGSARWSQGDTIVLAAVYGPKAGTRKNENPEKASIEVIWKPKSGQIGSSTDMTFGMQSNDKVLIDEQSGLLRSLLQADSTRVSKIQSGTTFVSNLGNAEREYEMILKRTLHSICLLTIHPNTTTSVILQVVNDDGALLPCAINAACAALVDAGIPLKHLAVAICCGLVESGSVILDPTKLEEQKMQAFAYLVFPNSTLSVLPKPLQAEDEQMEHGIITSFTHGAMPVDDYLHCLERGRSASTKISEFLRRSLQSQVLG